MHRVLAPRPDGRLLERRNWRAWSDLQTRAIQRFNNEIANGSIALEEVDVCPCGSDQFLPISRVDRFSIYSPTKLCMKCGLILTSPRISASSIGEYYEEHYPHLLSSEKSADELRYMHAWAQGEKVFSYIREAMAGRASLKILDYGAGLGDVSSYIREHFRSSGVQVEIFAIESNTRVKQELLKKDICVIAEQHLDKHLDSFDLIILSHILEHIHDFRNLLRRLRQTLSETGRIYLEVPGVLSIHKRANYMFSYTGYAIHAHLYNFSLASLCFHVVSQGYEVLSANEDVQLLLAADSFSSRDFGRRSTQLKQLRNLAEGSVAVVMNYLSNLEDLWPQLKSIEDTKNKLAVAEGKFEDAIDCLRNAEVSLNSQLKAFEVQIEDPKCYLDEMDIFERIPLKSWFLNTFIRGECHSLESDFELSVFINGMQVLENGFIQLTAPENSCFIYTPQSQDFKLILKPGQDIEHVSIRTLEGEESIQSESRVVFKLHAGLNRIHLSALASWDSTRAYALLLKPSIQNDTGLRNIRTKESAFKDGGGI